MDSEIKERSAQQTTEQEEGGSPQKKMPKRKKEDLCCPCSGNSTCSTRGSHPCPCAKGRDSCSNCESYNKKCTNKGKEKRGEEGEEKTKEGEEEEEETKEKEEVVGEKTKEEEKNEDKEELDSMLGNVQLTVEFLKKVVDEVSKAKSETTRLRAEVRKQGGRITDLERELKACKEENRQLKEAAGRTREQLELVRAQASKTMGLGQQRPIFQVPQPRAAATTIIQSRNNFNNFNNTNNRRSPERTEIQVVRSRSESKIGERERVAVDQSQSSRERQKEIDRSKNLVIWGLERQLNVETAVREVVNLLQVKDVEVVKLNSLRTREGKLLVIITVREEREVRELLSNKFRLRGLGISITPEERRRWRESRVERSPAAPAQHNYPYNNNNNYK